MARPDPSSRDSNDRSQSDDYPLDPNQDPLGLDERSQRESEPDDCPMVQPKDKGSPDPPKEKSQAVPPKPFDVSTLYEPPPLPPKSSRPEPERSGFAEYFQLPDKRFSRPSFFRTVGRAAGGLGVAVLMLSVLLIAWKRTWFTGAVLLILMFLVGEATAVILEALERIERRPPRPPQAGED